MPSFDGMAGEDKLSDIGPLPPGMHEATLKGSKPDKATKAEKSELQSAREEFDKLLAAQEGKDAPSAPEVKEPEPEEEEKEAAPPKGEKKLREKLVLAGAPRKVIESLPDEDVREWWQRQEIREHAQAEALERASKAERALKETANKGEQAVPTPELDLDEIAAELSEQFGEGESGVLVKALKQLVGPLQSELQATKNLLHEAARRGAEDIAKQNRERLQKRYSRLEDSDAWEIVDGRVRSIFEKEPGRYTSAQAAYDDVVKALYGEPQKEDHSAEKRAQQRSRIEASSVSQPSGGKKEKPYSPMDAHWAAFQALDKNPDDVESARRAFLNVPIT